MNAYLQNFIPKSFTLFKEGYTKAFFLSDLLAGFSVGVISLPLALAFAIASGVPPEKGLITAIVAGFLISFLGGSRVQIGGPTGAFVVLIFATLQRHGIEGLETATLIAGCLILLFGLAKGGVLLKFIPYPVTTGFTTGLALTIFFTQIRDFFGLKAHNLPPEFLEKCRLYCQVAHTWDSTALGLALCTLVLIFALRRYFPKWPGAVTAVVVATVISSFFNLPVETIASKFGAIPQTLPWPKLPDLSLEMIRRVFPDALSLALLGAIESLLSAAIADGMTGHKHRSNCELAAQGLANLASPLFGGIPATGAVARTAANVQLGAKTPVAGMLHAVTLLVIMLFLGPLTAKIPLPALAAVLTSVAWNMSELPHFFAILKGQKGDALLLLVTFLLTVLIDLSVAVQIGVVLSALLFLKRMSERTTVKACQLVVETEGVVEQRDDELLLLKARVPVPADTAIFEINGPFFYPVASLLDEALALLNPQPKKFILRLHKTPLIDSTGMQALKRFGTTCKKKGIAFFISETDEKQFQLLDRLGIVSALGRESFFHSVEEALA